MTDAARRYSAGYISEDRKGEGLILAHDVASNIVATVWYRLARSLRSLCDRMKKATAAPFVVSPEIRTPSLSQRVGNLSGRNQQKVSVEKWLAASSKILIIDGPTVGIDIRSKAYLHDVILRLSRAGTAMIVTSSDMPELVALADRIAVMKGFRLVEAFDNSRNHGNVNVRIMQAIRG